MSNIDEINATLSKMFSAPAAEAAAPPDTEAEISPQLVDESGEEKGQTEAPKEKGTRADKRIQKLLKENKELQGKLAETQNQFLTRTQQIESEFQRLAAESKVNQSLLSHNKTLAEKQAEQQKLASMTQMQRWEYENKKREENLLRTAEELASKRVEEFLRTQEAKQKEQETQLERQRLIQMLEEQSNWVATNIVAGFDEKIAEDLKKDLAPWVSTAAAAFQITPEQAAEAFTKTLDKYFKAKVKAMQAQTKDKVEKNRTVAPNPVKGVNGTADDMSAAKRLLKEFSLNEIKSVSGHSGYMATLLNPNEASKALKKLLEKKGK